MKPDKSIFDELGDDPKSETAADARAEADAMKRWLKTWGTANRAPKPTAGEMLVV